MASVTAMNETINEETYRRLKREVEEAKTAADRSRGALEQLMNQLKSDFNCDSLKEAKVFLDDLEVQRDKALRKFQEALATYEKEWKHD